MGRFRQRAGDPVKSAFFTITNGRLLEGQGQGHGVGLCQLGAIERAKQGHNYRQILEVYFPGTKLGLTAQGLHWTRLAGERVELWTTSPSHDGRLIAAAERALREAERRSGFTFPDKPRLRVFPSVATYRDATGEPGFIAASTVGRTIRLQPARTPQDAVLLHEMMHVVVDSHARRPLPAWFREGLALYLEHPDKPPTASKLVEQDVAQPSTEAAMRQAYEAARSRVRILAERYGRPSVLSWIASGLPADQLREKQ